MAGVAAWLGVALVVLGGALVGEALVMAAMQIEAEAEQERKTLPLMAAD